jgi:hypothetical protein
MRLEKWQKDVIFWQVGGFIIGLFISWWIAFGWFVTFGFVLMIKYNDL